MARSPKPTFITELPLVVSLGQKVSLLARFEAGRRLFNAVNGDVLRALSMARQSKAWQSAKELPKASKHKDGKVVCDGIARRDAFKACNLEHGFTEYAMHGVAIAHKTAAGFADRMSANETQKIATRVFAAVKEYAFGKRGRPRFKGRNRPLKSLEGKSNAAGIRWSRETGTVSWGKGFVMPVLLPSKAKDPYIHACLKAETKYCRIVWRMEHGQRRWFVQLVQDGVAPAKYEFLASGQMVGLDIGPSTVAFVADAAVGLERFAPSVDQPWRKMRMLQRAQDRSRRSTNRANYAENGTIKKGPKRWDKSARYHKRQHELADLERCLAAARKRDHGELANKILGFGDLIQTEKLSYKGFQKSFGRSAKVRASGMFVELLKRKAESAGGKVVEVNTRVLKMSQYDHVTGQYTKKPLSQRWHDLGGSGLLVQRDCYSAFLAKNTLDHQHKSTLLREEWAAAQPLLRREGLCVEKSESGTRLRVPTVAIPLDRISRRRRFVPGHVQNVVAFGRESGNPEQSVSRTPGFSHGEGSGEP